MEQRPRTVPIVAAFLFVATVIAAVVGVSLIFPNRLLDWMWQFNKPGAALFRSVGRISGVFLLLLGSGTCASAIGLLSRKRWAWCFAVVLFAVDGAGDVVSVIVTGDWPRGASGVLISSAFLYSLSRRPVRGYFMH